MRQLKYSPLQGLDLTLKYTHPQVLPATQERFLTLWELVVAWLHLHEQLSTRCLHHLRASGNDVSRRASLLRRRSSVARRLSSLSAISVGDADPPLCELGTRLLDEGLRKASSTTTGRAR